MQLADAPRSFRPRPRPRSSARLATALCFRNCPLLRGVFVFFQIFFFSSEQTPNLMKPFNYIGVATPERPRRSAQTAWTLHRRANNERGAPQGASSALPARGAMRAPQNAQRSRGHRPAWAEFAPAVASAAASRPLWRHSLAPTRRTEA